MADAGILLVIAALSVVALKKPQLAYMFESQWTGFGTVLRETGWAAIRVWTLWAASTAVIGGILLRVAPALGLLDAAIAGATGLWILAYVAGNALGPIGLLRAWTIWTALALGAAWLWRNPPRIERPRWSRGLSLAALTLAIAGPGLLVLQLGSPVPPYMDVLATPAAAQRIITFGRYLPFDNDPYGHWDSSSQLPGLELFYAVLGLGSHASLALLTETAAILPMIVLFLLTVYRLGLTIAGDTVGGMACLFVFATMFLRVLPYMHGRSVAFVLVGAGLGFLLDRRRHWLRVTLGALALATAVASHAIIGALGMAVVGIAVLLWLLSGEVTGALAGAGVLAGASLVALPTVAIGLRIVVPYPVLPLTQLAGIALIGVSARALHERELRDGARWLQWLLALFGIVVLFWQPYMTLANNQKQRFPTLVYGAGLGLALMLATDVATVLGRRARDGARQPPALLGPLAGAIALAISIEYASNRWWTIFTDPRVQTAVHDWFYKVDYWYPYILLFPTAYLAAWLYATWSRRWSVLAVLALLCFPWRDRIDPTIPAESFGDPNYYQHSITEGWAYQLETGKTGYWGATRDRRWAQSPAELELAQVLRREIAAGRITPATHVVLLADRIYLYGDNVLFSVYTGVNADVYLSEHEFDPSIAGSRLRPMDEVYEHLARRPPYVVIHKQPVTLPPDALQGYSEIFNQDGVRLLRDDALMQHPGS